MRDADAGRAAEFDRRRLSRRDAVRVWIDRGDRAGSAEITGEDLGEVAGDGVVRDRDEQAGVADRVEATEAEGVRRGAAGDGGGVSGAAVDRENARGGTENGRVAGATRDCARAGFAGEERGGAAGDFGGRLAGNGGDGAGRRRAAGRNGAGGCEELFAAGDVWGEHRRVRGDRAGGEADDRRTAAEDPGGREAGENDDGESAVSGFHARVARAEPGDGDGSGGAVFIRWWNRCCGRRGRRSGRCGW